MRPILALTLALGLLLAPAALAKGADDRPDDERHEGEERAAEAKLEKRADRFRASTDTSVDEDEDADDKREERKERAFDRTAWADRFAALRLSIRENATAIRAECHAMTEPSSGNLTKEDKKDRAHCIRDGYKALFEVLREELRAMRLLVRAEAR